MKLAAADYIVLIVGDLDRALDFYTGVLGLPLGHRSGDYAQLQTGATRLAFYTRSAMANNLAMSLKAPAANAAFAELVARGAPPVAPPTDRFWGQRTAYVHDPDGHLVELAQDLRPP